MYTKYTANTCVRLQKLERKTNCSDVACAMKKRTRRKNVQRVPRIHNEIICGVANLNASNGSRHQPASQPDCCRTTRTRKSTTTSTTTTTNIEDSEDGSGGHKEIKNANSIFETLTINSLKRIRRMSATNTKSSE